MRHYFYWVYSGIAYISRSLDFVQALAVDPSNTVFALVRNVTTAKNLHDFAAAHPHKNVHVFKADLDDISSIKVSLVTIGN